MGLLSRSPPLQGEEQGGDGVKATFGYRTRINPIPTLSSSQGALPVVSGSRSAGGRHAVRNPGFTPP